MFDALATTACRARSGPVAVHYVPAGPGDVSRYVAYSVPRRVGTAVVRNTYRRRLRAIIAEGAGVLPAGSYLVGVRPGVGSLSFLELRRRVIEAMRRASGGEGQ